jgi:hypothetical protein
VSDNFGNGFATIRLQCASCARSFRGSDDVIKVKGGPTNIKNADLKGHSSYGRGTDGGQCDE